MVYLKSVENVITLGKLIGLLFLFCLPLLSILFLKTKMNDHARPVMGTIFLVYVYVVAMSEYICRMSKELRRRNYVRPTRMLKVFFLAVKPVKPLLCITC